MATWEGGRSSGRERTLFLHMKQYADLFRPDPKDALKRNIKDLSTNARFGMFRAKKKILRKAEL